MTNWPKDSDGREVISAYERRKRAEVLLCVAAEHKANRTACLDRLRDGSWLISRDNTIRSYIQTRTRLADARAKTFCAVVKPAPRWSPAARSRHGFATL